MRACAACSRWRDDETPTRGVVADLCPGRATEVDCTNAENGVVCSFVLVWPIGQMTNDQVVLSVGAQVGGCLVDGLGDGVMVQAPGLEKGALRTMCFGLLQVRRTYQGVGDECCRSLFLFLSCLTAEGSVPLVWTIFKSICRAPLIWAFGCTYCCIVPPTLLLSYHGTVVLLLRVCVCVCGDMPCLTRNYNAIHVIC